MRRALPGLALAAALLIAWWWDAAPSAERAPPPPAVRAKPRPAAPAPVLEPAAESEWHDWHDRVATLLSEADAACGTTNALRCDGAVCAVRHAPRGPLFQLGRYGRRPGLVVEDLGALLGLPAPPDGCRAASARFYEGAPLATVRGDCQVFVAPGAGEVGAIDRLCGG